MDPLTFALSTSFYLPFLSCPPAPQYPLLQRSPVNILYSFCPHCVPGSPAWKACLLHQADCLTSTHIWAAGRCRRRSHSCSACCHQQFRDLNFLWALNSLRRFFFMSQVIYSLYFHSLPWLLPDPCTCLFPVLSVHLTLLV